MESCYSCKIFLCLKFLLIFNLKYLSINSQQMDVVTSEDFLAFRSNQRKNTCCKVALKQSHQDSKLSSITLKIFCCMLINLKFINKIGVASKRQSWCLISGAPSLSYTNLCLHLLQAKYIWLKQEWQISTEQSTGALISAKKCLLLPTEDWPWC